MELRNEMLQIMHNYQRQMEGSMTDSVFQQVQALLGSHSRERPVENGPNLLRLEQELKKIEGRLPDLSGMFERLSKLEVRLEAVCQALGPNFLTEMRRLDHTQAELVTLNQERFLHTQQEIAQLRQEMQQKDAPSSATTVTVTPQSEYSGVSSSVSVLQTELRLKANPVRGRSQATQESLIRVGSVCL